MTKDSLESCTGAAVGGRGRDGSILDAGSCSGTWGVGAVASKGDSCSRQPLLWAPLPHATTARSGDKLLGTASLCSRGTQSGNIRVAAAFCFLGANIYQCQGGQLNGEGETQTGIHRGSYNQERCDQGCFDQRKRVQARGGPVPPGDFRC